MRLVFGVVANWRSGSVPFTLTQGVPPGSLEFPAEADLVPEFGAIGTKWEQQQIQFLDPDRLTTDNQHFNLTTAHQLKEPALEAGHLGNLGRKSPFPNINLNNIPPDTRPTPAI